MYIYIYTTPACVTDAVYNLHPRAQEIRARERPGCYTKALLPGAGCAGACACSGYSTV